MSNWTVCKRRCYVLYGVVGFGFYAVLHRSHQHTLVVMETSRATGASDLKYTHNPYTVHTYNQFRISV